MVSAVVDLPIPTPGQGEVLVRILLRPINPADVFSLIGFYKGFQPESLPAVPGLEGNTPPPPLFHKPQYAVRFVSSNLTESQLSRTTFRTFIITLRLLPLLSSKCNLHWDPHYFPLWYIR